jgi:hypothetical protein
MKQRFFLLAFLLLSGCAPNSLDDFQQEGDALCRQMIEQLQKVHTREQLLKAVSLLELRFDAMVDLMIQARLYQQEHPNDESFYESIWSDSLRDELLRLYALEGGRDLIERAQREPLLRLDAFEKNLVKQNGLRRK